MKTAIYKSSALVCGNRSSLKTFKNTPQNISVFLPFWLHIAKKYAIINTTNILTGGCYVLTKSKKRTHTFR